MAGGRERSWRRRRDGDGQEQRARSTHGPAAGCQVGSAIAESLLRWLGMIDGGRTMTVDMLRCPLRRTPSSPTVSSCLQWLDTGHHLKKFAFSERDPTPSERFRCIEGTYRIEQETGNLQSDNGCGVCCIMRIELRLVCLPWSSVANESVSTPFSSGS
jgi:hypothetical protein